MIRRVPIQLPISGVTPEQLSVTSQNSEEARRAIGNIRQRIEDDSALVWDDLRGNIRDGDANSVLTYEVLRSGGFFITGHMRHDQPDTQYYEYQMPHRWARTAVRPHIHYMPLAMPASDRLFVLQVIWSWVPYNEELRSVAGNSRIVRTTISTTNVNRHRVVELGDIPVLDSCKESSVLLMSVKRYGTVDTYTDSKAYGTAEANVALLSADLHFQADKRGTKEVLNG